MPGEKPGVLCCFFLHNSNISINKLNVAIELHLQLC